MMAHESNNLRIPFLQIPGVIQKMVLNRLEAKTFHRFLMASNFPKKRLLRPLQLDLDLYIHSFVICNFGTISREIEYLTQFQSHCPIKLKQITLKFPRKKYLQETLQFIKRIGITTNVLDIVVSRDEHELLMEITKLVCPDEISILCLSPLLDDNFFEELTHIKVNTLSLGHIEVESNFNLNSFVCNKLDLSFVNLNSKGVISFIESALSGRRPDDSSLSIWKSGGDDSFETCYSGVYQHFQHRLSVLYEPELHEMSVYSERPQKGDCRSYILFSSHSSTTLWILRYLPNRKFMFHRIFHTDLYKLELWQKREY